MIGNFNFLEVAITTVIAIIALKVPSQKIIVQIAKTAN